MLCASTACTFFDISTSKSRPSTVCFAAFYFLCASRHNGVHFYHLSTSKSGPSMACFVYFYFQICFASQPSRLREWCVLPLFTSKCASRHSAVHFLDITTSKSGPTLMCFVHFDFGMCFVPQRRALFPHLNLKAQRLVLFPHLNFQQWSEHDLFCTCLLPNVFRATTANKFSFISNLASYLRTRRLSEPTFRPSGATIHWKNTVFYNFPIFSRTCIFSLLTLSISDLLHLLSSPF